MPGQPPTAEERETAEAAEIREILGRDLETAIEMAGEMGARYPITQILAEGEMEISDEDLQRHGELIRSILTTRLGVNFHSPLKTDQTQGDPDSHGAGPINITVFRTNTEGIFVQEWQYNNGHRDWAISPWEHPED